MAKEGKSLSYGKILTLSFLISSIGLLSIRSVNAIVYYGQTYGGWSAFGYGFGDLQSMYYSYPGWIDFFLFFMLFTSLTKFALGKKFESESGNAGKGISLALGLIFALGMVLWEFRQGIYLFEHVAVIGFLILTVGVFYGMYYLFAKKMNFANGSSIVVGLISAFLFWVLVATFTGYGFSGMFGSMASNFGGFTGDGSAIRWLIGLLALAIIFAVLFAPIKNFFKKTSERESDGGSGGDRKPWFRWPRFKWPSWRRNKTREDDGDKDKNYFRKILSALILAMRSAFSNLTLLEGEITKLKQDIKGLKLPSTFEITKKTPEIEESLDRLLPYIRQMQGITRSYDTKLKDLIILPPTVMRELERILEMIKPYTNIKVIKEYYKEIKSVENRLADDAQKLIKNARILYDKFGDVSVRDVMKQLSNASLYPDRTEPDDGGGSGGGRSDEDLYRERDKEIEINGLKNKYLACINLLFKDYTEEQKTDKSKFLNYLNQIIGRMKDIIAAAQKKGCSPQEFLSAKYGGEQMFSPEQYWSALMKKYPELYNAIGSGETGTQNAKFEEYRKLSEALNDAEIILNYNSADFLHPPKGKESWYFANYILHKCVEVSPQRSQEIFSKEDEISAALEKFKAIVNNVGEFYSQDNSENFRNFSEKRGQIIKILEGRGDAFFQISKNFKEFFNNSDNLSQMSSQKFASEFTKVFQYDPTAKLGGAFDRKKLEDYFKFPVFIQFIFFEKLYSELYEPEFAKKIKALKESIQECYNVFAKLDLILLESKQFIQIMKDDCLNFYRNT